MVSRAAHRSFLEFGKHLRSSSANAIGCNRKANIFTSSPSQNESSTIKPKLTSSYSHVCEGVPLLDLTVGGALMKTVEKFPDRECLVFCETGERLNFSELAEKVDQLAAGFLKLGLKKGDRVGIWGPSTLEWILTQFATGRIGIILVNVNPAYQSKEMEYALQKVGCKAIVSARNFKTQDYYSMFRQVAPEIANCQPGELKSKRLPELTTVIMMGDEQLPGTFKFGDVLQMGGPAEIAEIHNVQKKLQFDDPINIQFTSGTTGHPKGATLSHHNIINNAWLIGRRVNYHIEHHRILCQVPLYHCYGMVAGCLGMAVHGAANVFPVPGYDPAATMRALNEEK